MQTVTHPEQESFNETRVAQLFEHRHWTHAIAEEVVEAWRQSGMTKKQFAHRFRVKPYRLEHWDRRLRKEKSEPPATVRLHPVKVAQPPAPTPSSHEATDEPGIEMALPSGAVLRIREGFDVDTLRRVLEAVGC